MWFYKVSNDGYTIGAHRKQAPGCQLVEALDLFHRYVRHGKQPPETRHSFCIPADWIKVLDPRAKEKIRFETRGEMGERALEEKNKLAEKLDAQVAAKKLTATERKDRLAQYDELWRSKTENSIAQKIEHAHAYSFSIASYRSSFTEDELRIWNGALPSILAEYEMDLDRRFAQIKRAGANELPKLLTRFDPRSALEVDLVREVFGMLSASSVARHSTLKALSALIARQAAHVRMQLKRILKPISRRLKKAPDQTYKLLTVRYYGRGVALRSELLGKELNGNNWFQVAAGDLIFSKIDARHGAFGIVPSELDGAVVSNEFPTFLIESDRVSPTFLVTVLSSIQFYSQVEAIVAGATRRRRLEPEQLLEMSLPLPDPEHQKRIAVAIEENQMTLRNASAQLECLKAEVNRVWET